MTMHVNAQHHETCDDHSEMVQCGGKMVELAGVYEDNPMSMYSPGYSINGPHQQYPLNLT